MSEKISVMLTTENLEQLQMAAMVASEEQLAEVMSACFYQ